MRVLGIETATDICSVALAEDGNVVREIVVSRPRAHAEILFQQIASILEEQEWKAADLGGIAVSIGPGSFTGLRIGLAAAKGIAWAQDIPLAAVPTLGAVALKAVLAGQVQDDETVVAAVDSRKGELYRQIFTVKEGVAEPTGAAQVITPAGVLDELTGYHGVVTGPSLQLRSLIAERGRTGLRVLDGETARCSAGAVARLGTENIKAGEIADRAGLEPLYIQQFEPKLRTRMGNNNALV